MALKSLTRSYAGGEITPELFGRVDLAKFQTGLKLVRNFIILPHGPAANRTGFEYVLETKFSAQKANLLPFIYNTSQAYQLEFGNFYVRFHTNNGTVLEANQTITSATNASPGVFTKVAHGYVNGDWVFWSGVTGMSELNGRFMIVQTAAVNTFTLTDLAGVAFNTTALGAYTAGSTGRVYEVVTPYAVADVFDLHITQSADVLTLVHPGYDKRELKRLGAASWTLTVISVVPTQVAPTVLVLTPNGAGAVSYSYIATAIGPTGLEESLGSTAVTNGACQDLSVGGAFNTVTWTNATGAVRYYVYKKINGLYGFVGQASDGAVGFKDANVTPNVAQTPPIANDPFSTAGTYPGAVGYYQGRRWFAGSTDIPQGLYATRSGTESNMAYSIPTQANDSITVKLQARRADTIRHIVPLTDLLLLTSGGEWRVTAGGGAVVTAASIAYTPEDYVGANNVPPVVTSGAVIYAQSVGGRLREMLYSWQQQGYLSQDLSIMAPHLFDGYTVTSMAYTRQPYSVVWAVSSSGDLIGLTYVQEHDVKAWHHHDTSGVFEAVCATPEGNEDVLYAIVKRTINGRDVRYMERLRTRNFGTLPNAFFVDAGATYNGAPATTIDGLWHLVGQTVAILADGAVQPAQVVSATGTITLDAAASIVNVGIGYNCDLEMLPFSAEIEAAGQGTQHNVNRLHLRVNNSSTVFAGPNFTQLREVKQRTTEPYGSPQRLFSGVMLLDIDASWNESDSFVVRQPNPLPLTLLSHTMEVALGG